MIRLLIVLPVYLAAFFFIPRTPFYAAFEAAVRATESHVLWHLVAYGVGLAIGLVGAAMIEFVIRPEGYGFDSVLRVLRMGCIGLIVTCGYQLYAYFTSHELSVFILLTPALFVLAETLYEIGEYLRASRRRDAELWR